jgi:hypothetical protein
MEGDGGDHAGEALAAAAGPGGEARHTADGHLEGGVDAVVERQDVTRPKVHDF